MKFVVFTGAGRHLAKMRPVIDALHDAGHEILFVTTQMFGCTHEWDWSNVLRAFAGHHRRRLLSELRSDGRFHGRLRRHRAKLYTAVGRTLRAGGPAPWYLSEGLCATSVNEGIEDRVAFELLLEDEVPDGALVLHENNFHARTLGAVCEEHRCPLFSFQEGTFYEIFPDSMIAEQGRHSSRVFLWGDADRERLVAAGVPAERLDVAGPPHLDASLTDQRTPRERRAALGFVAKDPLVVVAAPSLSVAPLPEDFQAALLRWAAAVSDIQLAVKWRPGEVHAARDAFDAAASRVLGARYASFWQEEPLAIVAAADVVIGHGSTLAAEAVALGRPFLELAWGDGEADPVVGLSRHAGVELLVGPDDLARLDRYARGSVPADVLLRMEDYRRRYFTRLDGRATERCTNAILETCARTLQGVDA